MRRPAKRDPEILIREEPGKPISIRIRHYGRVPDLTSRYSPEVLQQAVNKFRSKRERAILSAARGLSPVAYRIVEEYLIHERAAAIQRKLDVKSRSGSVERSNAFEQQDDVAELRQSFWDTNDERRDVSDAAEERAEEPEQDRAEREDRDRDAPPERGELLIERLARKNALADRSQRAEPMQRLSRRQQAESRRIMAERDESLMDLREFTPPKSDKTLIERLANGPPLTQPREKPDRDRGR